MFQLFTGHHQAEELRDFFKFFGLMMTREELKHVAK
jgi:hypothetical protein